MATKGSPQVLSFFSGAGGLDLGVEQAGLEVVVGQELDERACQTLETNNHPVVRGDICALHQTDPQLSIMREHLKGDLFAVIGGPPCQSFSTAGKRKGTSDPRGTLIFEYLKAIQTLQPRFAILENVKGVLSTFGTSGRPIINEITDEFARMGYHSVWGLVDAVQFGAPQFRERLIVIASRDNEQVFVPFATHFQRHQSPAHRWQTLGSAIGDLPSDQHEFLQFSSRVLHYLRMVPEGGNWKSLPAEVAQEAMGGAWKSDGGKVGFYRRLKFSEPAPTLVTSPIQKATMLAHPTELRPLSVQEYARIQGFPDNWIFTGTLSEKYRQIGNAVPSVLGKAIGEMLLAVGAGKETVETKRRRGTSTHSLAESILAKAA